MFSPDRRSEDFRKMTTHGNPETPIVLYVGRLAKEKGLATLKPLIRSMPNVQFVFIGDGPIRKSLEKDLAFKNVTFTGFLQGERLAEAYASADVFLTPSQTEIYPNIVLEAFRSGLPAVMYDGAAMRDISNASLGALLAKPDDLDGMRTNLITLLNNPDYRRVLSDRALKYAKTQTWENSFQKLIEHLQSLRELANKTLYYPVVEVGHQVDELRESIRRASATIYKYKPPPQTESLGTRLAKISLQRLKTTNQITSREKSIQENRQDEFDTQFYKKK